MNEINLIYIVDDDLTYQFITKKIIGKTELVHETKCFKDGKEAIDALVHAIENKLALPEAIFLDISMPVMDGRGFLNAFSKLKENVDLSSSIIIYIVSSSVNDIEINDMKQDENVSNYYLKPVGITIMLEMLHNIIATRKKL